MRSVEMKNRCLLYYGNPVGYRTEQGVVADSMFRREELEDWLARKGLAVRWEDGIYDRLSSGGYQKAADNGPALKSCRIWQLGPSAPAAMRFIRFEQETSKMWPWLISGDEMLAQETTLREIAGRLTAAGEWDTESIYESLTEAFGNNLSLDKQSKDDTKEEERNINIKQDQLDLLWQLEEFRKKHEHQAEPSDWAIRMCEAFVARSMGFTDRVQWTELLRQKGETLFTFDWKSGSVSDHVVQWCKENNRNWRYSHLGELQVAHGGEWRKVDYFCRDGSETRVYFPPEPVQEQQLHALAEAPAVHLRDLLTLGLPDHDVYLVHAAEDVGWVPAADLPRLTAQGKEEFSALLDAKIAAIRPGPYGVELVLDGVNSQLLAQYDETLANSSRAEHAMELFL